MKKAGVDELHCDLTQLDTLILGTPVVDIQQHIYSNNSYLENSSNCVKSFFEPSTCFVRS